MKFTSQERQMYKVTDSHRNQTFVGTVRRDPTAYGWTWKAHINFADGQNFSFVSQRTFSTEVEATDYMRKFICDRIDNRLSLPRADRF
ncbi:MAG TPA: hypothetical protein VIB79_02920 [Candidatus Binatia bacterium]|jgi:hypothetical protein